jgi:YVTN family beta-propeller protein
MRQILHSALMALALFGNETLHAATEWLYVGNNKAGTVSVVEVPGFRVIREIDVMPDQPDRRGRGGTFADDLVLPADGSRLYVSRAGLRDVAAFELPSAKLLWRVPTVGMADHFALSPDGSRIAVSVYNEDHALLIDTAKGELAGRFETCSGPHGMRFSADGARIYTGCMIGDELMVTDAQSLAPIRRVRFEEGVRPFDLDPSETRAWVQLTRLHGLVEVDMQTGRIAKTVHLPVPEGVRAQADFPHTAHHGLALVPGGQHLCIAGTMADYAAVLSVPALDLLAAAPVGREPSWVIPSLDGRYCYVSSRKGDTVSVIAVPGGEEVARIAVGAYPQRMWAVRAQSR